MAKRPDDFPEDVDQALPWPAKDEDPTDGERRAFTAARLEMDGYIKRDFHRSMTPTAKLVGSFLLESVNSETLRCFPSYRTILETLSLGKNEKTVQRAVEALRKRGWIYVWRPDRNRSNHFVFLRNDSVISQILNYQDAMRVRREEDRLERDRTQMSVRGEEQRTQMSVREQTPMSGKSFKIIHEPIVSIEEEGSFIEGNEYASVSQGDEANMPFAIPESDEEAENLLNGIFERTGKKNFPALRNALKFRLLEGSLTPALAVHILVGPKQEAA
jgi:hypothetical protein